MAAAAASASSSSSSSSSAELRPPPHHDSPHRQGVRRRLYGGGGDRAVDCGVCAICLDKIALQETALVKGCDHAYWFVLYNFPLRYELLLGFSTGSSDFFGGLLLRFLPL
ncbi:hypothetical protein OsI_05242 [Oryza sativa Indica Group]|uniref:Uncharacterized protein n=1 Tax=Oryza sativa subsp. indica TaxID=39946 RepID=A2WZ73_ORYSI|nr:hypothetical protein OsI_05242 [Oryza sativa Indica Group]